MLSSHSTLLVLLSILHISDVLGADAPKTSTGNFYLGREKVSRDQAEQLCEKRSMELVSIQNADKNEAIFQFLKENGVDYAVWVSGHKNSNGAWTWLDGEEIKYTNWGPKEPNGARGNEGCIEVFKKNSSVLWNDQPCEDKRGFICAPKKVTENFFLGTEEVSRDQAEQLCEERSMELVSIQNPEKNKAIFYFLQANEINYAVWTSGRKISDGKPWTWLDGEEIKYFNWGPHEPNEAKGNENCIEVAKGNSTVLWNDDLCGVKRGFICEKNQNECKTKLLTVTVDDKVCTKSTDEAPNTPSKKFYLSTQTATRAQALKHCSDMFMQLASLRDEDENTDLFKLIRAKETLSRYWISANKKPEGPWKWLNDEPITYFNWAKGAPHYKGNGNICLEVDTSEKALLWNDQKCCVQRHFVCEKLNPIVKITVNGNFTISHRLGTTDEDACTVVVNTK